VRVWLQTAAIEWVQQGHAPARCPATLLQQLRAARAMPRAAAAASGPPPLMAIAVASWPSSGCWHADSCQPPVVALATADAPGSEPASASRRVLMVPS
jgi:hypothetical protein